MKLHYNKIALGFFLLFSTLGFSQNEPAVKPEKKIEAGFEGMVAVSFNSKAIGINVGGPSLKFKCSKNFKIGVGAFPSLLIMDKKAVPKLGVSPIIEYKHWMIIAPYYGYDTKNKLIWTYGLGYKFF